ncbi:ribosome recycling factor [Candidatus Roizmanbacteria bacterium]|nr:ribosome recycling factor [Candidatus Roizmanbacteria bacterium]
MQPTTQDFKQNAQQTILQLKEDLKAIRSGRATPAVIEGLIVETYGGSAKMRLMEIATITNDGPTVLIIAPFDPSTSQDIEKAILKSPLGLSPQPQGGRILIRIPPLSQEQREKLMKVVSQKIEDKKNVIRNHRDDARKKIKSLMEAKEVSEDERHRFEKEIDTLSTSFMDEIETIRNRKEEEIMAV